MVTRTRTRQPKRDDGRSQTVTLQDVAQVAGVTPMTVSRVIKGADGVGAATRERVLRIAEELNYTANPAARSLATGKTGVIAVISGGLNHYYSANIVHRLESKIASSGYEMRMLSAHRDVKGLVNSTKSAAVDGVIIAGRYNLAKEFRAHSPQVFQACVFIDAAKHDETDYVHANLGPAVEEALELMMKSGRTRIAYVGHFDHLDEITSGRTRIAHVGHSKQTTPKNVHLEERLRTYLAVMQRAGRVPELITRLPGHPLSPHLLKQYIADLGTPDAMLCMNDEGAMFTYRVLRDLGYRVPEDVLLVGCDGLPFMECFDPPLSTIAQPMEEMCALAWEFLQARIADPTIPLQQVTFDARLVVRPSLLPPAPRPTPENIDINKANPK